MLALASLMPLHITLKKLFEHSLIRNRTLHSDHPILSLLVWKHSKGDIKVIVPVFIDDITLVSKSESAMASTVTELSKHFKLRDLGSTTLLLGIQVKQDCSNGSISLSQEHYIRELLECFNMLYEPKTLVNYQLFHSKYHTSKSKIQHFL
jgi:hypothetical protein